MWVRLPSIAPALLVLSCGMSDLERRTEPDPAVHRAGPVAAPNAASTADGGTATAPPSSAPTASSDTPPPAVPAFCTGADFTDPAGLVLLAHSDADIVAIRADGARLALAPLSSDAGSLYWQRGSDSIAILEYLTFGGYRVLRTDLHGNVLWDVELRELGSIYGSPHLLAFEADGTVLLPGQWDSAIRIRPDGTIDRKDGAIPSPNPPTPDGDFVLGEADVPGWQIIAVASGVVPLDRAFYEVSSGRIQRVRHRSAWVPDQLSHGRIVYLGETPEGVALVDEGVAGARVTPLSGQHRWSQIYGSEERLVVKQNDTPVAWIDGGTRAVTVLPEVIALLDAGAAHVGWHWQVLVQSGVARRAVDTEALTDADLSGLGIPSAASFDVHEREGSALVTGDGVPVLWVDRKTGAMSALDGARLRGAASGADAGETLYMGTSAVAVVGGLPRSRVDLTTGAVLPLALAVPPGSLTRTHAVGAAALVTVDGAPRFLVREGGAEVLDVDAGGGPFAYDTVSTSAPWLAALRGAEPVFRVNVETGEAARFPAAAPPLPHSFWDARFADDPANHPPFGHIATPAVTPDGNVLSLLRDDAIAIAYTLSPGAPGWTQVGSPVRDVVWAELDESARAWVVRSGHEYPCYCTWSRVSWASPPAGLADALTEAVQLVPRTGAPAVTVQGGADLAFHSSETCVVVTPSAPASGEAAEAPFAFDLETGARTDLGGLRNLVWIDGE